MLDESVVLDHRTALAERQPVDVAQDDVVPPPATPAWLFHTSFCCSTLLARAACQPRGRSPQGAIRAATEAGRHAKDADLAYGPAQREREVAMLRERFAPMIDAVIGWARSEAGVLPVHPALRAALD